MEEGGKQIREMNDMFFWDASLSLRDGGSGGGGKIDVGVEEEESGEGKKKRARSDEEELRERLIDDDGDNEGTEGGKAKAAEQIEFHIQTERERRKKMRSMFSTLLEMVPRLPSKADKSTIVEHAIKYIKSLEQDLDKLEKKKQEMLKLTPFSASSIIPTQHQEQVAVSNDLISRETFLAEYSSSTSITPTNSSTTTTPRGTNTCSPLGSPIMMMNNVSSNNNAVYPSGVTKLMLAPSSVMFQTFTSKNLVLSVCGYDAHFSICGVKKFGFYTGICWVLEKYNIEVKSLQISSDEQSNRTMLVIQATTLLDQYPATEVYKAAAREMVSWVSS